MIGPLPEERHGAGAIVEEGQNFMPSDLARLEDQETLPKEGMKRVSDGRPSRSRLGACSLPGVSRRCAIGWCRGP